MINPPPHRLPPLAGSFPTATPGPSTLTEHAMAARRRPNSPHGRFRGWSPRGPRHLPAAATAPSGGARGPRHRAPRHSRRRPPRGRRTPRPGGRPRVRGHPETTGRRGLIGGPADAEDRGLLDLPLGHEAPEGPVVTLVDGVRLDGPLGGLPLSREGDVVQLAAVLAGEPLVVVVLAVRGPGLAELRVVGVEAGARDPVQLVRTPHHRDRGAQGGGDQSRVEDPLETTGELDLEQEERADQQHPENRLRGPLCAEVPARLRTGARTPRRSRRRACGLPAAAGR